MGILRVYDRLVVVSYNSADVYNLHGAKRLVTITNVLSASCPSINQDGKNKPFLHIDCFTLNSIGSQTLGYLMKHTPNSASSFLTDSFVSSLSIVSGMSRTHMPTLRKLTLNIHLFQLKGQDLALSNDMHAFL